MYRDKIDAFMNVRRNRYMGSAMAVNEAVRMNRHDHEPNFNKVREKKKQNYGESVTLCKK